MTSWLPDKIIIWIILYFYFWQLDRVLKKEPLLTWHLIVVTTKCYRFVVWRVSCERHDIHTLPQFAQSCTWVGILTRVQCSHIQRRVEADSSPWNRPIHHLFQYVSASEIHGRAPSHIITERPTKWPNFTLGTSKTLKNPFFPSCGPNHEDLDQYLVITQKLIFPEKDGFHEIWQISFNSVDFTWNLADFMWNPPENL